MQLRFYTHMQVVVETYCMRLAVENVLKPVLSVQSQ